MPVYVKDFLKNGKEYIDAYRSARGGIFDKKLVVFYMLFALVIIGGSFILSLYIFPRILPDAILSRLM